MNSINEIITQRRKELGLSQLYISDALGYSVQTISKWEQGRSLPNLVSWGALAKILQIDLDALINGRIKSEYNDNCLNYTFSSDKFANNLRKQRKSRNMTQKDLASQLSIPYQTLLAWEKATSFPSVDQFKKLSVVLNLSYDELYFAEESLAVCEPLIETKVEQELVNDSVKVKSWSIKAKVSLALALTSIIIIGGALIVNGSLTNKNHQPDIGNLPSSEIVTSEYLSLDSVSSIQNHQSDIANIPSSNIVSSNNLISGDNKVVETLGKPFYVQAKCERHFYDISGVSYDLKDAIVPVPNRENVTIKSVGEDYTYDGKVFDIISSTSGIVTKTIEDYIYGKMIFIKHKSGLETIYASLGTMNVEEGQKVEQGEVIAKSGESLYTKGLGSSLHFEILKNDVYINPYKAYSLDVTKINDRNC